MVEDINSRILQLFELRIQRSAEISEETVEILLDKQRKNEFGDDEELLADLIAESGEDQ
jgi:hypothetical protein